MGLVKESKILPRQNQLLCIFKDRTIARHTEKLQCLQTVLWWRTWMLCDTHPAQHPSWSHQVNSGALEDWTFGLHRVIWSFIQSAQTQILHLMWAPRKYQDGVLHRGGIKASWEQGPCKPQLCSAASCLDYSTHLWIRGYEGTQALPVPSCQSKLGYSYILVLKLASIEGIRSNPTHLEEKSSGKTCFYFPLCFFWLNFLCLKYK